MNDMNANTVLLNVVHGLEKSVLVLMVVFVRMFQISDIY